MRITSDAMIVLPCCEARMSIEEFAEAVIESAPDSEDNGKLLVCCPECSEMIEIDLQDPNG